MMRCVRSHSAVWARRQGSSTNGWLIAILLILTVILFFKMMGGIPSSLFDADAQPRAITPRGDLAQDEQSTIELFGTASRSVVHINTSLVRRDRMSLDLLEIPQGSGSGFIWDDQGHIVTNFHVIQGAQVARVVLQNDETPYSARLVGAAPDKDLAVLKIDAPQNELIPIPVGESSNLRVGQKVYAIGNPFGLDQTLTTGVIGGLGRSITSVTKQPIFDVIQTDAAINPGNSGGPLLDSAGRLIGVNTAIYSPSGVYAGVGFAIPVDTVNIIVPQLISTGKADRPGLGISMIPDNIVEQLVARKTLPQSGALVRDVVPGGSAEGAGIRPSRQTRDGRIQWGDLIVAVDGNPVRNNVDLQRTLDRRQIGDLATVTILRSEGPVDLQVALQPLPQLQQ